MTLLQRVKAAPSADATAGDAIEARGLAKRYGRKQALTSVDLDVRRGETLGIIGPNGAGKTTLVEILMGLRRADGGEVRLFGKHRAGSRAVQRKIGVQLQEARLVSRATVREYLKLFSVMYGASTVVVALAERLMLGECLDRQVGKLSGGERQRLLLGLALIGDPELIFLDEPTTGLDPIARRELWAIIRTLQQGGRTLILITHYMDEIERLCDRVAVVVGGRVVITGTPAEVSAFAGMPGAHLDDVYEALVATAEQCA